MTTQIDMTAYHAATKIARSLEGDKAYEEITRIDAEVTDEAFIGLEVCFGKGGRVSSLIAELTTQYDIGYPANPLGTSFLAISEMRDEDRLAVIYEHIKARIASTREFLIEDGALEVAA